MPKARHDQCCPRRLLEQVVALADKRIEETRQELMNGFRKTEFGQWVHRELSLFCTEEIYAKATGCQNCSCLALIHEAIFSAPVLHVLTSSSANPYWFWRIVKATATKAETLPIGLALIEQAAQDILAAEGAKFVQLTGGIYTNAGGFDIESLRRSYKDRSLRRNETAKQAALDLGILIVVPNGTEGDTKLKLNPLFA